MEIAISGQGNSYQLIDNKTYLFGDFISLHTHTEIKTDVGKNGKRYVTVIIHGRLWEDEKTAWKINGKTYIGV